VQDSDDERDPGLGSAPATITSRLSVVVIDDEPSIRTLVRMLLERADRFEVGGEAATGSDGLELIRTVQPDIVLLDLLMPDVGGREVLPHIIRDSPGSMVLVLSSVSSTEEAEATFAEGAFAYIEKTAISRLPTVIEELRAQFERALDGETVWAPGGSGRIHR
jgi:DNA-binding NarL/FixJ family response regulator